MYDYACMTLGSMYVCMQLQEFDGDLTEKSCGVLFELIRITQQVHVHNSVPYVAHYETGHTQHTGIIYMCSYVY